MNVFEIIKSNIFVIIWNLFINIIAASKLVPPVIRTYLYNLAGLHIKNFNVSPGCFMGSSKITIGKSSFINYNVFFDSFSPIKIGNKCFVAMEVMFCTSEHEKVKEEHYIAVSSKTTGKPITIEDNCWIGARAIILPGVTIKEGCIIAAGTVVTKDCEAHCLYAGVPAKKIREFKSGI